MSKQDVQCAGHMKRCPDEHAPPPHNRSMRGALITLARAPQAQRLGGAAA